MFIPFSQICGNIVNVIKSEICNLSDILIERNRHWAGVFYYQKEQPKKLLSRNNILKIKVFHLFYTQTQTHTDTHTSRVLYYTHIQKYTHNFKNHFYLHRTLWSTDYLEHNFCHRHISIPCGTRKYNSVRLLNMSKRILKWF